jgi:hypothetical protein
VQSEAASLPAGELDPEGQLLQAPAPGVSLNSPGAQGEHGPPSGPVKPAIHSQVTKQCTNKDHYQSVTTPGLSERCASLQDTHRRLHFQLCLCMCLECKLQANLSSPLRTPLYNRSPHHFQLPMSCLFHRIDSATVHQLYVPSHSSLVLMSSILLYSYSC